MLVARPRYGFYVRTITVQEIDDLFEVRISLEQTAIDLACRKADAAGLQRLQALVNDMVRDASTQPQHQRIASDLAFHTLICELSGNAHLHRIFLNIQTEMCMIIALIDAFYDDPSTVAAAHNPIVDALMRRDVDTARAAVNMHLQDAWQHVRALFVKKHGAAP